MFWLIKSCLFLLKFIKSVEIRYIYIFQLISLEIDWKSTSYERMQNNNEKK